MMIYVFLINSVNLSNIQGRYYNKTYIFTEHEQCPRILSVLMVGAVLARLIRPWTLSREVPGSNPLTAAIVPYGKTLYPHFLVPWKRLKAVGPLV